MTRHLILFAILLTAIPSVPAFAAGEADEAKAMVVKLWKDFPPEGDAIIRDASGKQLSRYFDAGLVKLILKDQACVSENKGGVCAIDFNILLCAQDTTGAAQLSSKSLRATTEKPPQVQVDLGDGRHSIYEFKREAAGLRISDIRCPDPDDPKSHESLRKMLQSAYPR